MNAETIFAVATSGTFISVLLGVVMFGMGLATRLEDFKVVFSRPWEIAVGCAAQFTVMPALAWALSRLFDLDEALTVGVVLVGCCPGGTASNVITYLAKGDLALSVGMTGVSTLLAPFLTPALTLLLAGRTVDVNAYGMFVNILWVVILPIVLEDYGEAVYEKLAHLAELTGVKLDGSDEEKAKAFIAEIRAMNRRMEIPTGFDFIKEEDIPQMVRWALAEANPVYPVPVVYNKKRCEKVIRRIIREA